MNAEQLGSPSIKIGGLQIWVHGRESSHSSDSSSDWLIVTAHCGAASADVWTHGSIMMLSEISHCVKKCEEMNRNLSGHAQLGGTEPELSVTMEVSDRLGHVLVNVSITPEYLSQQHTFKFHLDQSYLPTVIRECKAVLSRFGIKDDTR